MSGAVLYDDPTAVLDGDGITLRRYYFPLGTSKRIRYTKVRGVEARQKAWWWSGRLWGSSDLVHWLPLDPQRRRKSTVLVLDLGARVKPAFSPEDPDRVLKILRERTRRN